MDSKPHVITKTHNTHNDSVHKTIRTLLFQHRVPKRPTPSFTASGLPDSPTRVTPTPMQRNLCSLMAVSLVSMPSTVAGYMLQRMAAHVQINGVNTSMRTTAQDMFQQSGYPLTRYLWKGWLYAVLIAPLFKLAFAGPMLVAKDWAMQPDCRYPNIIYYSGMLSTVALQVLIDFDRRKKQLVDPNIAPHKIPRHYWCKPYLRTDLPVFSLYMGVANCTTLFFYDAMYDHLKQRYPTISPWSAGAYASILTIPLARILIVPFDTLATRIMSGGQQQGLPLNVMRRALLFGALWKLVENGFLLTASPQAKARLERRFFGSSNDTTQRHNDPNAPRLKH